MPPAPTRHPVVIVGGGPIGLAAALDLGNRGVPVLVLDDHEGAGLGSRAICFSKRTLEICDRLGAAGPMLDKGVIWNVGKVFRDDRLLYEFNLLPEDGHAFPAFINLQQPYFEKFLHDAIVRAARRGRPDRDPWSQPGRCGDARRRSCGAGRSTTPDGPYRLEADWLIACDGARSPAARHAGPWI